MKLTLLTLFLFCLHQLPAQITLAADVGYSIGSFNHPLEVISANTIQGQRDDLGAINSPTLAIEVDFAPATSKSSWGLRLQYSERGYRHLVRFDDGQTFEGPLNYSRVDYFDVMPRITYRHSRVLSGSIGPYVSLGAKEEGNFFIFETEHLINMYDYGVNLETRITLDRFFFYAAYQRSFRKYDYSAATDFRLQPHGDSLGITTPSPISAFRFGVGGIIIR